MSSQSTAQHPQVDPRGLRFAAAVTTVVLALTLVLNSFWPLAVQAVVFAIGALGGPRRHPYGRLFATLVAPRLGPVKEREPVPPLKFAQLVGLIFAIVGTAGFAVGAPLVGVIATAFALVAAFLNAAFGICLGCQLYPLVVRIRPTAGPA